MQKEWKRPCHVFDLENTHDLGRLADALLTLEPLKGLVVLDEVQRLPELFPVLRVLADRRPVRTRFLVLGSASPNMQRQGNESLAGRIAYYALDGLSLEEVGVKNHEKLWIRGGLPTGQLHDLLRESGANAVLGKRLVDLFGILTEGSCHRGLDAAGERVATFVAFLYQLGNRRPHIVQGFLDVGW